MVSALKVDGRRLHELAREGVEIERAAAAGRASTASTSSASRRCRRPAGAARRGRLRAGTYVRSLAADLGRLLGTGAHLRNLRRTAVEPFTIDEAAPPESCVLLPPIEAVRALRQGDRRRRRLRDAIAVGKPLPAPAGDGPWAMVTDAGELLAVYEPLGEGRAKPAVVLGDGPIASARCAGDHRARPGTVAG